MAGLGVVVECNCQQWQSFAEEVFRAQVYFSQNTGNKWLGGMWSFCPWCGTQLRSAQHGVQADRFWPDAEIDAATDEVIRRGEDELQRRGG